MFCKHNSSAASIAAINHDKPTIYLGLENDGNQYAFLFRCSDLLNAALPLTIILLYSDKLPTLKLRKPRMAETVFLGIARM